MTCPSMQPGNTTGTLTFESGLNEGLFLATLTSSSFHSYLQYKTSKSIWHLTDWFPKFKGGQCTDCIYHGAPWLVNLAKYRFLWSGSWTALSHRRLFRTSLTRRDLSMIFELTISWLRQIFQVNPWTSDWLILNQWGRQRRSVTLQDENR